MIKKERRLRRAVKTRAHIRDLGVARLTVHRTPQHIYAQLTDASGAKVLAAASTLQEAVAKGLKGTGNVESAARLPSVRRRRASPRRPSTVRVSSITGA
jgi:large subunit ribosomal protein L18